MATIEHCVTDQGNGGAYCSACDADLGSDPSKSMKLTVCPKCKEKFTGNGDIKPYQFGGSDY